MHPGRPLATCLALVVGAGLLAACSGAERLDEPECNATVVHDKATYRVANGLQVPRRGARLGVVPYADCQGHPEPQLGYVVLYEVEGEDPATTVLVDDPDDPEGRDATYLNEDVRYGSRPQLLKEAVRYPTCARPGRIQGQWLWIDPEDLPNGERPGDAEVPYTVELRTRQGADIGLGQWADVALQAEVTARTRPVPDVAMIRRATLDREQVTVALRCDGAAFEVTSIALKAGGLAR